MRFKRQDPAQWHDVLSIWPRRINHTIVWMELIQRRRVYVQNDWYCDHSYWEYRLKDKK